MCFASHRRYLQNYFFSTFFVVGGRIIVGQLVYHYQGNNLTPREKEGFQFGIYRGFLPTSPKVATHVAYYDKIRYAKKSCKKLQLKDLGYSCDELEKQTIKTIDSIQKKFNTEIASFTKEEKVC